ncbi:MAG: hypothetical protein K2X32_15045 [Phycisphaerales bacterium]|nr:hypothetical protein [Phycisphaerales bacterium]
MKSALAIAALSLMSLAGAANAQVVFTDDFSGNTNANLATQTFDTGATTGFTHWTIGTPGDMDAGFFSVVNRARDVHNSFTTSFDADNNPEGAYAIYNGFSNETGNAYRVRLLGLDVGVQYSISVAMLTLAADPPFPQISNIRFTHNLSSLGDDITLTPVPSGQETWTTYTRTFVATGEDTLTIQNLGSLSNAGNDFGLDNVSIARIPSPGAAALMGLGILATKRRRRA